MKKTPNIIFIIADDLGYGDLSCQSFATKDVYTPCIDRIAKEGVAFNEAYTTSPVCSPSRTGMITGRYQQRWGNYWFGEGGLPVSEMTIPKKLKEYGYLTKKVGKTHHNGGDGQHPLKHGFDEFYGFVDHTVDYLRHTKEDKAYFGEDNAKKAHMGILERNGEPVYDKGYTTELFTNEALEFISRDHSDAPFYLEISYNAVHQPIYVNHDEYNERFGIRPFKLWEPDVEDYETWHDKWGCLGEVDPDGRKRYLSTLAVMDDGIGKLLDALQNRNIEEDTIVIFLSDNGGAYENYAYNAALKAGKYTLCEGGIRVPLLLNWPGQWQGGRRIDGIVSTMDLFATIMDIIASDIPEYLDGKSLLPLIEGDNRSKGHDTLVWDNGYNSRVSGRSYAVRKDRWKLVYCENVDGGKFKPRLDAYCEKEGNYARTTKQVNGLWFYNMSIENEYGLKLYDLEADITESKDVSKEHPEIVQEMMGIYKNWRAKMSDPIIL